MLCAPQGASACRRAHIAVHVCACTGSPHHLYPHTHMHTHTGVHTHAGYSCTHIHASTPRMCTSQCVTWAPMCTPMFVHARQVCTCICTLYISLCVHMFHACARMPRVCAHMCAIPAHVCGCMCTHVTRACTVVRACVSCTCAHTLLHTPTYAHTHRCLAHPPRLQGASIFVLPSQQLFPGAGLGLPRPLCLISMALYVARSLQAVSPPVTACRGPRAWHMRFHRLAALSLSLPVATPPNVSRRFLPRRPPWSPGLGSRPLAVLR